MGLRSSRVIDMATKKITVTVPDWLHPYITEAAERRDLSVSEWLSRAAQVELYREEGETRRAVDAGGAVDRVAQAEADELAMLVDQQKRVRGAA